MSNKPLSFKGLNIRIPIIIPIKGRFINHGSTLGFRLPEPSTGFDARKPADCYCLGTLWMVVSIALSTRGIGQKT